MAYLNLTQPIQFLLPILIECKCTATQLALSENDGSVILVIITAIALLSIIVCGYKEKVTG